MSRTLTDFHLGNSNSNMQTLDKRISASTDQLDCIRGTAANEPSAKVSQFTIMENASN